MGEAGREAILNQCRGHFAGILDESVRTLPQQTVGKYADAVTGNIAGICENRETENKRLIADKEKLIDANGSVLDESESINREAAEIGRFIKQTYPLPAWPDNLSNPAC